jgi:hypothetical protein
MAVRNGANASVYPKSSEGPVFLNGIKGRLEKERKGRRAEAKFVSSFLMFDKNELPLYWLIFCTNNLRGLEEMKKAMWHVDKTVAFDSQIGTIRTNFTSWTIRLIRTG